MTTRVEKQISVIDRALTAVTASVTTLLGWINGLSASNSNFVLVSDGAGSLAFKEVVTTEGGQTINGSLTATGVIAANGGDSDDWNNSYSWGDHYAFDYYSVANPGDLDTFESSLAYNYNSSVGYINDPSWLTYGVIATRKDDVIGNLGYQLAFDANHLSTDSGLMGYRTLNTLGWGSWRQLIHDAGGQTIAGTTLSADLVINESADHSETPTAGKGQLWVKNDTPCSLYFTDDAGTDHQLGVGIQYPDAITGHIKAGNTQIPDGDTTTTDLNVTSSLASATWESIGPTGSGADNIWAQLDDLPESAAILIVDVSVAMIPTSTTSPAVIGLYATSGGIASPTADAHKNRVISSVFDVNASTTVQSANTQRVFIPLHTDQTFKMYWTSSNVTGSVFLYYRGFMSD